MALEMAEEVAGEMALAEEEEEEEEMEVVGVEVFLEDIGTLAGEILQW